MSFSCESRPEKHNHAVGVCCERAATSFPQPGNPPIGRRFLSKDCLQCRGYSSSFDLGHPGLRPGDRTGEQRTGRILSLPILDTPPSRHSTLLNSFFAAAIAAEASLRHPASATHLRSRPTWLSFLLALHSSFFSILFTPFFAVLANCLPKYTNTL
ncbi:hypothetical protein MAPG_08598 [Magnaporthiopsis poae ATCC 64411]|uniref:Uncharacterized protein n=1 Tax=Magnaporthiopsis poae (strain ATCC 64411 / 73-15) TaxID=644358 RepID=A0A0C4E7S6_MAGP6|nr:hypothetical protein MAPG_08598 [Magnaporthiopsis poae ATCC 64411]